MPWTMKLLLGISILGALALMALFAAILALDPQCTSGENVVVKLGPNGSSLACEPKP